MRDNHLQQKDLTIVLYVSEPGMYITKQKTDVITCQKAVTSTIESYIKRIKTINYTVSPVKRP